MKGKNDDDILHHDGGGDDHILRPRISLQKKKTHLYASNDDKKDNYDDEIQ